MQLFKFSTGLSLVLLFTSCTSMLYTNIDVLRPAKVSFEKGATNLLLCNNASPQPESYGHVNQLLNDKKKNVNVNTDSLAIFCLSVVNEEFQKNNFFNQVHLNLNLLNTGGFFNTKTPGAEILTELAKTNKAEILLILNQIKVTDNITEYFNENTGVFYAILDANYETNWTVWNPKTLTGQNMTFRDTIYWDYESYNRKKALAGLPLRSNALIDGALYTGQSLMKKFVPWWDKEDRYLFLTENKILKAGMDSVYVKNWEAAIKIWKTGLESKSKQAKVKLLHNIATVYEMSGDMDNAMHYNNRSIKLYESCATINYNHFFTLKQYETKLAKRKKEIEQINQQLGVN